MKEYEICLSHYENYEEGEENRERERERESHKTKEKRNSFP